MSEMTMVERAPEWQPIATAPRDGTRVLLCEADQPTEVCIGWWIEGAWRDRGDIGCNGFDDYAPTHWMPLPFVPAALSESPAPGAGEETETDHVQR